MAPRIPQKHRHLEKWEVQLAIRMHRAKDPISGKKKFTQVAIARHLKTSQPSVSRAINHGYRPPAAVVTGSSKATTERNEYLKTIAREVKERLPTSYILKYPTCTALAGKLKSHPKVKSGRWKMLTPNSIARMFHRSGWRSHTRPTVVAVTQAHVDKRNQFAQQQYPLIVVLKGLKGYRRFKWMFMDETLCQMFDNNSGKKEWGPKKGPDGKKFPVGNRVVSRQSGRDKTMVFIFVAYDYLEIFCHPCSAGTVDSRVYQSILAKVVPYIRAKGLTLYADNASQHRSRSTQEFLRQNGVVELHPPPKSPDLNPTEQVISQLKRAVAKRVPTTVAQHRKFLMEEARKITPQQKKNYVQSFETKVKRCFDQKGYPGNLPPE